MPPDLRTYEVIATTKAFQRKVDSSREVLLRAAETGPIVVSTSWGKDSAALCHLALDTLGDVDLMHMACAHELPGSESVKEYFGARATIHELEPLNTIAESLEWLKTVGLPHERDPVAHRKIIQTRKIDRARAWENGSGYAVTVLGLRAQESAARRFLLRGKGRLYQLKSGHWMCHPLAWWTVRDVWAYLVSRHVPWARLYDCETHGFTREKLRNGGWLYTDGTGDGWAIWLRANFPNEWRKLVAAFPHMRMHS